MIFISQTWIYHYLLNWKHYSTHCKAKYSPNHFCLFIFSRARFFIIFISSSICLLCFSISESVIDSNNISERSCQISLNLVAKQASSYSFKIFSVLNFCSFLLQSKYSSFWSKNILFSFKRRPLKSFENIHARLIN